MDDILFPGVELPFMFKLNIHWLKFKKEFPFSEDADISDPRSASERSPR